MRHRIGRLVEPLLRWLFPGSGCHRLPTAGAAPARGRHRAVPDAQGVTVRRTGHRPLRGEDHVMVRPYLVEHERREEARRQGARRRAPRLATRGVDIGPRLVHGMEVSA